MRASPLSVMRGGINRLRVKGGARGDMLYDLTNAYITNAGSVAPREGTIRAAALSSATVGLSAFEGVQNVFANALVSVPAGYKCNLLVHPTNAAAIPVKIWFAKPFMGFLYVVAQFDTGDIFHFWLQDNGKWQASTVYKTGAIIVPNASPNGLAYQAVRNLQPYPTWSSNTVMPLNTIIEPTEYTGFAYKAIAVAGASPHTGESEPDWPTTLNGTIQEFGDFSTSSTAAGSTQSSSSSSSTPLGSNITDRYGDSQEIAGQTGTVSSQSTTAAASTAVTTWASGTTYAPGAVVRPSTNQGAFVNAIPNGDFEAGNDGSWVLTGGVVFTSTNPYQGTECISLTANNNQVNATMNSFGAVTPGQSVTASAYLDPHNTGSNLDMWVSLIFYDSGDNPIKTVSSTHLENGGYKKATVTGICPSGASRVRVQISAGNGTSSKTGYADLVTWSLEQPAAVSQFLYEAVQSISGTSASTEPTWPTVAGNTVIDGGVTWKAIGTSIITWQAIPIMESGSVEPTWPTAIGTSVHDGNMSWVTINRQVTDPNCPNTSAVALGASHVFAGNSDITSYCAAVDPTDWSSANNAGYLPTGLNNYGDNPVKMLALYRSNLMVFNAGGYQMWQIDPDPANMALLDAQPVGSIYTRAAQSVSNDLLFLTEVGVRNLGTAGASANMQIGSLGQPVDPLVVAALKAGTYEPLSLYYPGRGQYWLIFGPQAFVFTVNGTGTKSWSRYVFPDAITDWTLNEGVLYLRTAGNLVWRLDEATIVDDFGGANTAFTSFIQWPYLDTGALGINKMLVGVDLVGTGQVTIQIGYRQDDVTTFSDNPGFATSQNVTAPYIVAISDTVPGEPLPIPITAPSYSLILKWNSNQPGLSSQNSASWEWDAANLYVADAQGGGATG